MTLNITENDKQELIKFINSIKRKLTEPEKNFIIQYSYFIKYGKNSFYFACCFEDFKDEGIFYLNLTYSCEMKVRIISDKDNKEFILNDENWNNYIINDELFKNCQYDKVFIKARDLFPDFKDNKYFGLAIVRGGYTWWNHIVINEQ